LFRLIARFTVDIISPGTSVLRNVYSIRRGYKDIATRLNKLGADIEVV